MEVTNVRRKKETIIERGLMGANRQGSKARGQFVGCANSALHKRNHVTLELGDFVAVRLLGACNAAENSNQRAVKPYTPIKESATNDRRTLVEHVVSGYKGLACRW